MLVLRENSCLLWQMLVNSEAYLHLYPGSGDGFLSEHHQHFAAMVNTFLDEPECEERTGIERSIAMLRQLRYCKISGLGTGVRGQY